MQRVAFFLGVGLVVAFVGCRDELRPFPFPEPPSVSGVIRLVGDAPRRTPIRMVADPVCARSHPDTVFSEDVIVDKDNNLQNVLVYVAAGLEGRTFSVPARSVVLDQVGCLFLPHIFGIMAGQTLEILNSDPTLHNVHARWDGGDFNRGMPRAGMRFTKSFPRAQVIVHVQCDVHPWMEAWAQVLAHPYYAVSDAHGKYSIAHLPDGTYTIAAWHETFGTIEKQITLPSSMPLDFSFQTASEPQR